MKKSISSSFPKEGLYEQATLVATALLKLVVFGAGAYLSVLIFRWGKQTYQWESVGLIFGAVILVWQTKSVSKLISLRSLGFLTASTLIWILVYPFGISGLLSRLQLEPFYLSLGPSGLIALGTILLPIAHGWLLGAPWRRVLIAVPCIYALWTLALWWYSEHPIFSRTYSGILGRDLSHTSDAITYSMPVWQGAYLLCMFGSIPQFLKARFRSRKT